MVSGKNRKKTSGKEKTSWSAHCWMSWKKLVIPVTETLCLLVGLPVSLVLCPSVLEPSLYLILGQIQRLSEQKSLLSSHVAVTQVLLKWDEMELRSLSVLTNSRRVACSGEKVVLFLRHFSFGTLTVEDCSSSGAGAGVDVTVLGVRTGAAEEGETASGLVGLCIWARIIRASVVNRNLKLGTYDFLS